MNNNNNIIRDLGVTTTCCLKLFFPGMLEHNLKDYEYIKGCIHATAKKVLGFYKERKRNKTLWCNEEIEANIKNKKKSEKISPTTRQR